MPRPSATVEVVDEAGVVGQLTGPTLRSPNRAGTVRAAEVPPLGCRENPGVAEALLHAVCHPESEPGAGVERHLTEPAGKVLEAQNRPSTV